MGGGEKIETSYTPINKLFTRAFPQSYGTQTEGQRKQQQLAHSLDTPLWKKRKIQIQEIHKENATILGCWCPERRDH